MNNILTNQPVENYIALRQLNRYMIGHKGYIAGGVFKNIFNKEKIKDVDIFFENERDYLEAEEYFKKNDDYATSYENDNTKAFWNRDTNVTVELIKKQYGSPLDIISKFDFTITKFVYYKEIIKEDDEDEITWKIAFHDRFFEHLHMKRLVIDQEIDNLDFPVNTFNRMFRYAEYGYFPCRETKVKIIEALRELPVFSDELLAMGLYHGFD